jgi:hypothetical protein
MASVGISKLDHDDSGALDIEVNVSLGQYLNGGLSDFSVSA